MSGSKIAQIVEAVNKLVNEASTIQQEMRSLETQSGGIWMARPRLATDYLHWYTRALRLVIQTISEQEAFFVELYQQKNLQSWIAQTGEWNGDYNGFMQAFAGQIGIVSAIPDALAMRALDLRGLLSADLLDSELDAAKMLLDEGFIRAAGAVTGVVAEGHLKYLHDRSGLIYDPKDGIYKLADRLKQNGHISQADERQFQAVADIRNNCDHKNPLEPTKEEVERMIQLTNELIKRVQIP